MLYARGHNALLAPAGGGGGGGGGGGAVGLWPGGGVLSASGPGRGVPSGKEGKGGALYAHAFVSSR